MSIVLQFPSLKGLYLDKATADIFFKLQNERVQVPAHKNLLANGSFVFKQQLFVRYMEPDVEIWNVSSNSFKNFLRYFYQMDVDYKPENIDEIVYLAAKYDVKSLKTGCEL